MSLFCGIILCITRIKLKSSDFDMRDNLLKKSREEISLCLN